jgi:hypothetical protein
MAGAACEVGIDVDAVAHLEVEHLGAGQTNSKTNTEHQKRERFTVSAEGTRANEEDGQRNERGHMRQATLTTTSIGPGEGCSAEPTSSGDPALTRRATFIDGDMACSCRRKSEKQGQPKVQHRRKQDTYSGRPIPKKSKAATAPGDRKFKQLGDLKISPFPDYLRPTGEEVGAVEKALLSVHGPPPTRERYRFEDDEEGAPVTDRGLADGVLDAVIRCILGLNTNARVSWL